MLKNVVKVPSNALATGVNKKKLIKKAILSQKIYFRSKKSTKSLATPQQPKYLHRTIVF